MTSVFDLPDSRIDKATEHLTATDDTHFADVAATLTNAVATLTERLTTLRRTPVRAGKEVVERDLEIHNTEAALRPLRHYSLDLCLGRIVPADGSPIVYIGRIGLTDMTGEVLLVDWRTPAAAPFFAATPAEPLGLASRRRYRWAGGRIVDYWDEAFGDTPTDDLALDDDSALLATLAESRSPRMRDVLGTIAADQDEIIRASSQGALVVDGGPGTGKTVVALHRAAYLLYSDPRLGGNRGELLVVGPHDPYLAYVADVLPSLGEEGVRTCTIRDMVPEGATAPEESSAEVASIKAGIDPVDALERAVSFYEDAPSEPTVLATPWAKVTLTPHDWADVFDAAEDGVPHNEARADIWEALLSLVRDRLHDLDAVPHVPSSLLRKALAENADLTKLFNRSWPVLEATDIVGDLFTVPAYLRLAAPELSAEQVRLLQRDAPAAWTLADLPLLDAARARLGDPRSSARRLRAAATLATQREHMDQVVDDLLSSQAYDDGEGLFGMLTTSDMRDTLVDETVIDDEEKDPLGGPFAHIVVDEAQELTPAQWRMLLRRCPSRSFTIVGDRAQARHGFTESWEERLRDVGFRRVSKSSLTINYRTPEQIMAQAAPVIRAAIPDANVPTSIRSGAPVRYGSRSELDAVLAEWLASNEEGTACVIGDPSFVEVPRIRSLSPSNAKGLEFDLVVLVRPEEFGDGVAGAVDRYVAMTRATRELVILT